MNRSITSRFGPGAAGLLLAQVCWATTFNVPSLEYPTLQDAVSAAGTGGDIIQVAAGTHALASLVILDKDNLTIQGAGSGTHFQVSGSGERLKVLAPGVTIKDLQIEKTDLAGVQNIIYVGASGFTLQNTEVWGHFTIGDGDVSRAMVFQAGAFSGITISGNTFHHLRQPAYISGTHTGSIDNNLTYATKGWVLEGGNLTFTNNTWGTGAGANVYDVAILSSCPAPYHSDIVAMSNANNGAVIEDQRVSPAVLSVVYVDAATAFGSDLGGRYHPYATITPAATRVVPGGTVHVAAGTYNETVTFTRSAHLLGAGSGVTMWRGTAITDRSLRINRNNTTPANIDFEVAGFSFETEYNQTIMADWSNSYTQVMTLDIHDNHFAHVNTNNWGDDFALWVDAANQAPRGVQGAIRVHNNVFDLVTGGVLFENCRAVDVVDNTFNVTNEAVIFNTYSSSGLMGEQLVTGNTITAEPIGWAMGMNNYFSTGTYVMLPNVIRNNVFGSGLTYAIRYNVTEPQSSSHEFQIRDNSIQSGSIYVLGAYASQVTLDASGNWWGSDVNPIGRVTTDRADYTPWLGSGTDTSADPGFQGDYSTLWVDDGCPQSGLAGRIQEAIGLVSGSTIHVTPGTYVEHGQVVLDRDMSILGDAADRPVIMTDADTGSGNVDSAGWWLQNAGTACTLSNLIFDGSGHLIDRALYTHGTGTVSDCVFRHIKRQVSGQPYAGRGITIWGAPWTVQRCDLSDIGRIGIYVGPDATGTVIEDCNFTGKGPGDWLDYGVEIERGSTASVSGCTITACKGVAYDGSTSAGVLMTTYFTPPTTAGTITDCVITGNTTGIQVGYDAADVAVCVAHGNDLSNNTAFGLNSTSSSVWANATGNWWGAASGPHHAVYNPLGAGVEVSDYVTFDPFLSGPYALLQTASVSHISSIGGTPSQTVVTYRLDPALFSVPEWFSCTVMINYPALNLTPTAVAKLYNPSWSHTFQSNLGNNPNGDLEVTFTLNGLSQETGYTGDLFSVTFTGTGDNPAAQIDITNCVLRERPNTNIAVSLDENESIWVDGAVPTTPLALRALPRHNGVYLSWTPPTPAPAYYRIYRAPRTGYPWCPNLDLPPMATRVLLSGTIPGGQSSWTDTEGVVATTRDVYDYHLVAVDEVENASTTSAAASATNYFLGDWADHNGGVGTLDLVALSTAYGTAVNCGVNGELDVAPTSDMGSFGLPSNHDGLINFEDLIIFAMNYGVALEPLLAARPVTKDPAAGGADAAATLTLSGDESGIVLSLDRDVLGFSALLRTERELVSAELEDGLALFYRTAGGYRVDVAGLGSPLNPDRVVRLTFAGQGPLSLASAEGRDLANGALATGVLTLGGLDALPLAFELAQNVPNPFNPVTTIHYTLPEEAGVRLALYNALGQEVMVLVQGPQMAGRHEARLDASGLASGVYIYRLEAGPFVDQRKMILVK